MTNCFAKLPTLPSNQGFLGLPESNEVKSHDNHVVIIPFGLENSVTYGKGTARAPKAIIKASHEVELFDESLWYEPFKKFSTTTLKEFKISDNTEEALQYLGKIVENVLKSRKFPMVFGGEHSITAGIIKPFAKTFPKLTILHFDAHADLRDSYQGNKFSHASALRRCLDYENVNLVSIGVRNISAEEIIFLENNSHRIKIFWAKDKKQWSIDNILSYLQDSPIYLTVDVDVFDSSVMPATGTPEPGGLFWEEIIDIISAVTQNTNIVGIDLNELAPIKGFQSCDFLTAKLAYKILSLIFHNRLLNQNIKKKIKS